MTVAPAAPTSHASLLDKAQNVRKPGFFFFGANRRSGTTWLTTMLNSHPEVMIRNEGWFLNEHGCSIEQWLDDEVFHKWAELPAAQGGWLREIPVEDAWTIATRAMMEALMREAAARTPWKKLSNLKVIGDKTTTFFCTKSELLHRLFPEAKFIHMVRDGRDVVVSDMFLKFRYKDFGFAGAGDEARAAAQRAYGYFVEKKGEPQPLLSEGAIRTLAGTWVESIRGGARARELFGENYLEVRYEDLLVDPWKVKDVFAFLGVSTGEKLVQDCIDRNTFEKQAGGRKPGQDDPTHPSRKGISGDWRNYFTADDVRIFKEVAGRELVELGYERDDAWTQHPPAHATA
ncbi:MAG: sulfotransferase [Phycisphaeraceae bacterium]|nr:sulfotransferase [Phycisphaeraceae bacterium]